VFAGVLVVCHHRHNSTAQKGKLGKEEEEEKGEENHFFRKFFHTT
jgi:hypothetical protein